MVGAAVVLVVIIVFALMNVSGSGCGRSAIERPQVAERDVSRIQRHDAQQNTAG
jgi:hypothetical protein